MQTLRGDIHWQLQALHIDQLLRLPHFKQGGRNHKGRNASAFQTEKGPHTCSYHSNGLHLQCSLPGIYRRSHLPYWYSRTRFDCSGPCVQHTRQCLRQNKGQDTWVRKPSHQLTHLHHGSHSVLCCAVLCSHLCMWSKWEEKDFVVFFGTKFDGGVVKSRRVYQVLSTGDDK